MSGNPPPMAPMQSTTIKSLVYVGLGQLLLQLAPALTGGGAFDWKPLVATAIPIVAGILIRMGGGDVQAPASLNMLMGGLLNARNAKP